MITPEDKVKFVRRKAHQNAKDPEFAQILWSRHGITELINEGWNRASIEEGLQSCELIEDYPARHRPLPDCLVLGWLSMGEPFHAVVGIDESNDCLFIVTLYRPSLEEWNDDWRTRKK